MTIRVWVLYVEWLISFKVSKWNDATELRNTRPDAVNFDFSSVDH